MLRTACEADFGALCALSCIRMTASRDLIFFILWPISETTFGKRLYPANCDLHSPDHRIGSPQKKQKMYPGCLANAVSGAFYNVDACGGRVLVVSCGRLCCCFRSSPRYGALTRWVAVLQLLENNCCNNKLLLASCQHGNYEFTI